MGDIGLKANSPPLVFIATDFTQSSNGIGDRSWNQDPER